MRVSMTALIKRFLAHVIPGVARPLQILWNEMIGFLFLVLAAPGIWSAVSNFRRVDQNGDNFLRAVVAVIFAAVMMFFGITSFLRARRISRS